MQEALARLQRIYTARRSTKQLITFNRLDPHTAQQPLFLQLSTTHTSTINPFANLPALAQKQNARDNIMAPKLKLVYFSLPGKAETIRLLLRVGKVEFEDAHFERADWPALKATTPFGQVPVLYVDGKPLAQSAAIAHYAAKLAGLMPDDPWLAAKADEAFFFTDDLMKPIYPTMAIQDEAAKLKARQEVVAGPLKASLEALTKLLNAAPGPFLTGDKLTHGDLGLFTTLSTLRSGWLDGLPRDLLDAFPTVKAFRNRVAAVPEVKAFYDAATDDIRVNGFRADA